MKGISLILTVLFSLMMSVNGFSQPAGWQDKVSWTHKVEKINDHEAYVVSTAKLKEGWHIFSVNHDPAKADLTGYPTTFKFKKTENYKLIGKTVDGKKAEVHEDDLGVSLYFEKAGVFKQKIEVLTDGAFDVDFEFSFQICDENGCLFPPDQSGKVKISGYVPKTSPEKASDLKINGDIATDTDGNTYVQHDGNWVMVPEGNSPKFYKKYLSLGGSHEE